MYEAVFGESKQSNDRFASIEVIKQVLTSKRICSKIVCFVLFDTYQSDPSSSSHFSSKMLTRVQSRTRMNPSLLLQSDSPPSKVTVRKLNRANSIDCSNSSSDLSNHSNDSGIGKELLESYNTILHELKEEVTHVQNTISLLFEMQAQLNCLHEQAEQLENHKDNHNLFLELFKKKDEVMAQLDTFLCYPAFS
jgi:hypothetical protein